MHASRLLAPLALALALVCAAPASDGEPPMTDEDVVRLFAAGRSAEEIVREIERRESDFDLSPEMLEELRRVDLPPSVIDAMVRRQKDRDRRESASAEVALLATAPTLRISFRSSRTVSVAERIDPQLAAEWELGNAPEDRSFADLALYLACHTGDHVPDHWRSKSPLGRDFHGMRRHRLLSFVTADSGEAGESGGRRIKLDVPPRIELPLEAGVAHDLTLGLALQIGGRYRRVADDSWEGLVLGAEGRELEAVVRGRSPNRFRVRFVRDGDDESSDEGSEGS